jgi:tetratricopeptide (TPR) repeat protein
MKLKSVIIFLFFVVNSVNGISQNNKPVQQQLHTYNDFVEDENGNRLKGIKVQVVGGDSDITDYNGKFSVRAIYGDQIVLYRDGKQINSYIYNGDQNYQVNDLSINKQETVKKKQLKSSLSYKVALDSAIFNLDKQPLKSIQFVEQALRSTSNSKKTAKAYEVLADAFYKIKQYDLAESNYLNAYEQFPKSNSLQLKLAKTYYKNSKYLKAKKLYALVLFNEKSIPYQNVIALEGLASLAKREKIYKESINYLTQALALAKTHKITPKITSLNTKLAEVLRLRGDVGASKIYLQNSIVSANKEGRSKAISQTNKVADFYGRNNQVEEEIALRKKTLETLEKENIDEIEISDDEILSKPKVKFDIGNALVKQKKYKEAIPYFEESANEARTTKDIETEKDAVKGLSELYATIGDDKNAVKNYNRLSKLVDFSFQEKEREIAQAVARSKDIAKKQNRILSLEKDKALNASKYQLTIANNKRQQLIIYSLIGGLLLMLLSLFYMFRSNKQRKLANNLLALKSLRSQMNPHFIFNALNSVNSFISSNDERAANRYLTDFSTLMRSVLENSEEDFIPLEKEIELLDLYLKLEHSRFQDKFDYQFTIDENVKIQDFKIPPMLLQPYVENAVWHGLRYKKDKGLLEIKMQQKDNETLEIMISDNGIGRKYSKSLKSKNQQKKKSKGMQNIKQRIAILNEMYKDKVDVFIADLFEDETGTKVVLTLKKD